VCLEKEPGAELKDHPALLRVHEGLGQEGSQVLRTDPRGVHQARADGQGGTVPNRYHCFAYHTAISRRNEIPDLVILIQNQ
jgi:hypothetical protein